MTAGTAGAAGAARHPRATTDRTTVQKAAALVGAVFLVVGVAGFIPGVTTHYGDMSFAGHDSGAKLLGIFMVSVLHNIVHLLFGIAGLVLAKTYAGAKNFSSWAA
jgi:hypothetical protein